MPMESFEVIGQVRGIEIIATGHGIRDLGLLQEQFGIKRYLD